MKFFIFIFLVASSAFTQGDSLVEQASPSDSLIERTSQGDSIVGQMSQGDSVVEQAGRGDSIIQPKRLADSLIQPTRAPEYQPVSREFERSSRNKRTDLSLALKVDLGRLNTHGIRFDYGIRYGNSRLSLIGAFGIGYTGKTRVMRMNGGAGVCLSQTFLKIGSVVALSSGCGLGFWTIRDYCPDIFLYSSGDPGAHSTDQSGPFVQNEWFLFNSRVEFALGIVRWFGNVDLLLSPRRFTPSLGAGLLFPLSGLGERGSS